MNKRDKVQESCVYTRRKVSDLRAEARRLITAGEMPSLAELLSVVAEVRAKYRPQILAARRAARKTKEQ
jgi:hypothetical protein